MKMNNVLVMGLGLVLFAGCQNKVEPSAASNTVSTPATVSNMANSGKISDLEVEASCGECKFGMEGKGCDLAVRIDGKAYYVDGAKMSDHGDAHSDDGMCNSIRKAKVSGEIKDGRFVATSFELLPAENVEGADKGSSEEKAHSHGKGEEHGGGNEHGEGQGHDTGHDHGTGK